MTIFKNIKVVECPKCKGHGEFLGQKRKDSLGNIEDYKHIERGTCFLCRGAGRALYNDEYVFGLNKERDIFLGWSTAGVYAKVIGAADSINISKYYSILNGDVIDNGSSDETLRSLFFPDMYEVVFCEGSKELDILFSNDTTKPINAREVIFEEEGYSLDFLLYYDGNGDIIKPFYILPKEDINDTVCADIKGAISTPDKYLCVSGTYFIEKKSLCLGISDENSRFKYMDIPLKGVSVDQSKDRKIRWSGFTTDNIKTVTGSYLIRDICKLLELDMKEITRDFLDYK